MPCRLPSIPSEGEGTVVYNLSLIKNEDLEFAISILKDAFRTGVSVSGLVKFFPSGAQDLPGIASRRMHGDRYHVQHHVRRAADPAGNPVNPIGGGVVEIENRTPIRFTHIILYEHTTIDPLQVLISQKTTSVTNVMRKGSGNILANVREFHMEAEPLVGTVLDELASSSHHPESLRLGCPMSPCSVCRWSPQYIAIAAVGGTNPMAAIREGGRWVNTQAMKGMMDISEMVEIRGFLIPERYPFFTMTLWRIVRSSLRFWIMIKRLFQNPVKTCRALIIPDTNRVAAGFCLPSLYRMQYKSVTTKATSETL